MADIRGFLTPTDKLFLRGEKQYSSKQGRYERREAIRQRTRQAFYDFALLHHELDETERNKIFDPPVRDVWDLSRVMIETVAFMYHALEGDAGSNTVDWDRSFNHPFAQILEAGVRNGEIARQESGDTGPFAGHVDVTFDVDVKRYRPVDRGRVVEDLAENQGRGLTEEELRRAMVQITSDPRELRILAGQIEEERRDAEADSN